MGVVRFSAAVARGSAMRVVCRRAIAVLATALCLVATPAIAPAQSTRRHSTASQRAVDVVKLKSGKTLRGTIARSDPDGSLTLAVAREWLRKADAKMLASVEADETRTRTAALEQLRGRIKQELPGFPEESGVATFLRVELKRVEKLLADQASVEPPQFVWVELTRQQIARIAAAGVERRRIAAWSWFEQLPNVETRDADDLTRELKHRHIDPSQPLPDLADRLPPRLQDDREWSARMALITYGLGKPLDFQGTGDMLVRADRAKNEDLGALIAKVFGGQMDSLLKDLFSENGAGSAPAKPPTAWLDSAIREAERDKARAFRATRVDLGLARRQATVESVFVARLSTGKWEVIWSDRDTEDGSKERAGMEGNIAADPQVRAALGMLKALGPGADDQVNSAIRFGAATMAAQDTVNHRFSSFEEPYLKRLDGPPLWWPR
jgi:hypothetical protein